MGRADYLSLGTWNAVCFRCGRKRKASEMRKQWQGYWVCPEHWEPRQPQDFVKGVPDQMAPPWVQPPGQDIFVVFCTPNGTTAIAGYGVAGCMKAGYISPAFAPVQPPPIPPVFSPAPSPTPSPSFSPTPSSSGGGSTTAVAGDAVAGFMVAGAS